MRACKTCKRLMMEEACPHCSTNTTQYWTGFMGIVNPGKSEIAKRMSVNEQGQYALKVR